MTDSIDGEPAILDRLRAEIDTSGPVSFARFMERALYEPGLGYYERGAEVLGKSGDFFTSSDVGDLFGFCIARQLTEMDERLGSPAPLHVVEFGGGRGLLAADVLAALERAPGNLDSRLRYTLVDRSAGMRRAASGTAQAATVVGPDAVPDSVAGCAVAVELFDALPVHRLRNVDGRPLEIRVGVDGRGRLVEVLRPPGPRLEAAARKYGAAASPGTEAEVCLAVEDAFRRFDESIAVGYALIVDYGHEAAELYGPRHDRGTLLAYHRHTTGEDYLERVGRQDLTAHVNWTALEDCARELGWKVLGRTTQDRFLIANGALERFESADEKDWRDPNRVRDRMRAMQLIHPQGMGRAFQVLLLARGREDEPALAGLRDPFAREDGRGGPPAH